MMLGVSQGIVKCAIASCGLPRALSQLSSNAVQRSAPKKGGLSPRCPSRRAGRRAESGTADRRRTDRHRPKRGPAGTAPGCCQGSWTTLGVRQEGKDVCSRISTTGGGRSWPMPGMATKRAPGMRCAESRPQAIGTSGVGLAVQHQRRAGDARQQFGAVAGRRRSPASAAPRRPAGRRGASIAASARRPPAHLPGRPGCGSAAPCPCHARPAPPRSGSAGAAAGRP